MSWLHFLKWSIDSSLENRLRIRSQNKIRGRGSSFGTVQLRDEVNFCRDEKMVNACFGGKVDRNYWFFGVEGGGVWKIEDKGRGWLCCFHSVAVCWFSIAVTTNYHKLNFETTSIYYLPVHLGWVPCLKSHKAGFHFLLEDSEINLVQVVG